MFDSSGGDNKARVDEALRLIEIIRGCDTAPRPKDQDFVDSIDLRLQQYGDAALISPQAVFWLRDIKDQCL